MPSCSRMVVCSIRLSTGRSCSLSVAFLARAVSSSPSSRLAIVPLSLPSPLLVGAPSGQLPATVLDSRCPNNTKKSTEIIILAYLTNAALIGGSNIRLFPALLPRAKREPNGLDCLPFSRLHLEQNFGAIEIPCKRPRYCITI